MKDKLSQKEVLFIMGRHIKAVIKLGGELASGDGVTVVPHEGDADLLNEAFGKTHKLFDAWTKLLSQAVGVGVERFAMSKIDKKSLSPEEINLIQAREELFGLSRELFASMYCAESKE
jgi:hypothetical protein